MSRSLTEAKAHDRALDQTVVKVKFSDTPNAKTYRYALTAEDIACNGLPIIGEKIQAHGTSCDPVVIGYGRDDYAGTCRVAKIIARARQFKTAAVRMHERNEAARTGVWTTHRKDPTPMPNDYTCSKGLIENPTANSAELLEKHEAAIAAIKAREKAARKVEKAAAKARRKVAAAKAERERQAALVRATLEDIAADEGAADANRVAAAVALGNLVG